MHIELTGHELHIDQVVRIARHHSRVHLSPSARERVARARAFVDSLVARGEVVYGITTGFGLLKDHAINANQVEELQRNLIRSHASGVGEAFPEEVVRASILVRINSLLQGHSGVRVEVIERLIDLLNEDIYPFVPSKGSVGSSGDLAPLSHIVLVLMGEGEVIEDGKRVPSRDVLSKHNITPISLLSKEGLALNNGTSVQTGIAALAVYDAKQLMTLSDICLSLSTEAMMGSLKPYEAKVHALRPHPGQIAVAENVRRMCQDSNIMQSHAHCTRVQDAYSLRCAAQVHGASRDSLSHVETVISRELNSVTDNPLLFPEDGEAISAGHFHGEPIAQAMDILKIAVAEIANISERRTSKLVDPTTSEGLPAFLVSPEKAGLCSGLMIPQYVSAALVSENKVLAHPASVDSIPTSANQEDHVSMGTIAARQAREIIENVFQVLVIEMMSAAQGLEFRKPLTPGKGVQAAYHAIRASVPALTNDRILYTDIEALARQVKSVLIPMIEHEVGKLN